MPKFDRRAPVGTYMAVGATIISPSRASLLAERYRSGVRSLSAKHPAAFTREEVAVSQRCFCDSEIPEQGGEISAVRFLAIPVYEWQRASDKRRRSHDTASLRMDLVFPVNGLYAPHTDFSRWALEGGLCRIGRDGVLARAPASGLSAMGRVVFPDSWSRVDWVCLL